MRALLKTDSCAFVHQQIDPSASRSHATTYSDGVASDAWTKPEVTPPPVPERVLNYTWKLVWYLTRSRGWSVEQVDDAVQEIAVILLESRCAIVWAAFSNEHFATSDYFSAKVAIQRATDRVLDRLRRLHKIEIPASSFAFDRTVDPGKRQRRILPPDRALGEHDRQVVDEHDGNPAQRDLVLDVAVAMKCLPHDDQTIVLHRVEYHHSWRTIASELGLSVRHVKSRYDRARRILAQHLRPYDEVLPNPDPTAVDTGTDTNAIH
jgi:RNA polymerase sigma factor (sigma-70 family)